MENKKQRNTIITDWLEKYGDPEIYKKVEERLEQITKEIMSDKKQSSIEWLFVELLNTPKDKFEWHTILRKAKAMHRKEIQDSWLDGVGNWDSEKETEQYYKETFGEQDNE